MLKLIEKHRGYNLFKKYTYFNNKGQSVGQVSIWRFEICDVHIYKNYRNNNFASKMLAELLLNHRKLRKKLYLLVYKNNEIAIQLYKKLGFKTIKEMDNEIYKMKFFGNTKNLKMILRS